MIYIRSDLTAVQFSLDPRNQQIDRFKSAEADCPNGSRWAIIKLKLCTASVNGDHPWPDKKAPHNESFAKDIHNLHRNHGESFESITKISSSSSSLSVVFWLANLDYSGSSFSGTLPTGMRFNFHLSIIQLYLFSYFLVSSPLQCLDQRETDRFSVVRIKFCLFTPFSRVNGKLMPMKASAGSWSLDIEEKN